MKKKNVISSFTTFSRETITDNKEIDIELIKKRTYQHPWHRNKGRPCQPRRQIGPTRIGTDGLWSTRLFQLQL